MILLKKGNYEFKYIKKGSYTVLEEKRIASFKKLAKGGFRRVYENFQDVTIEIQPAMITKENVIELFENLEDGLFTYYSPKNNEMKTAYFFVEVDKVQIENSAKTNCFKDIKIKLVKAN